MAELCPPFVVSNGVTCNRNSHVIESNFAGYLRPKSVFISAKIEKLLYCAGSIDFFGFGPRLSSDIFVISNKETTEQPCWSPE